MNAEITDIYSIHKELNIKVHFYMLRAEKAALIDTGTNISPQNDILPLLKKSGLTFQDIDYILNTHGHIDHVGGNAYVKNAGKAQIFIHGDEASAVEDHKLFFKEFFAPMVKEIWGGEYVDEEWARYSSLYSGEVTVDRKLQDDDIIDLGRGCTLHVVHVPGHSPGSLGFFWDKEGIIFTGDSFPGLHEDDGGLPIISDIGAYKSSIKRVMDLPVKSILQSHDHRGIATAPSHIKDGKEVKQYLKDCYEAAERIEEAIQKVLPQAAGKPFLKIYDEVIENLPSKMNFKSVSQLGFQPLFNVFSIYFSLNR